MARPGSGRLTIELLPLDALKPDPRNPRQHGDRQIRQIARSIENFGFNVPILVDRENRILAGHGRALGAQKLGLQEVPVVRLEHLSAAQARAFAIADNRLTEVSTWDDRLLGEIFSELADLDLDFSLEATGFSVAEIDLRIEGLGAQTEQAPDPADQLPELPAGPPISVPGDLWLLGRHRVFCGDALDNTSYTALMREERAAMMFTDPPFNVRIDGHATGLGTIRHREFAMASGEMSPERFTSFLESFMRAATRYSAEGSLHYVCIDWRHIGELLTAGNGVYTELKNVCVWTKTNAGMGSLYRSQHELVFVFKHGRAPHLNNVELGRHGRYRTNVWSYPGANSFGRKGEEGNLLALHPTVKPVALVADAILDCTARGDLVLDPFLGSGSTVIAAERSGRVSRGIEIDPLYVDTVIRRWQRHTGETAIHAATGRRFDDALAAVEASHG